MPSSAAEPSVGALRAEAEVTRARLTGTVEHLRTQVADTATDIKERLSPAAIKAEVKDYVRDSGNQLVHTLEQRARDNPLQAVAVGAALAYPAFQLLRAMPAPLLLVGAGLLLSKTMNNQRAEISEATDTMRDRAQDAMGAASDAMDNATETARRKVGEAQDYARAGVEKAMERGTSAVSSIRTRRSFGGRNAARALSSVVLPVPVPPLIKMFCRDSIACRRTGASAHSA